MEGSKLVEFNKDTEGFVVEYLDSKKDDNGKVDSNKVMQELFTPSDKKMSKYEADTYTWIKKPENMVKLTQAMVEGYELAEIKERYFTKSKWRYTPQVLIYDSDSDEYHTQDYNYVSSMFQSEFAKSELPDYILNSPWWIPESEYKKL